MRFASLVVGVCLAVLGGCLYWDHGKGGVCAQAGLDDIPSVELINPDTLQCQTFSGSVCDPKCGLCPAGASGADLAPAIPSWGSCASPCRALDETSCLANTQCRVARDWERYYAGDPQQHAFVGCFPLDEVLDTSHAACAGRAAEDCSRTPACTALYESLPVGCDGCAAEQFKECIPNDQAAGTCGGSVTCTKVKPSCPTGTLAGVADGCWTGSCIPTQFCPQPG